MSEPRTEPRVLITLKDGCIEIIGASHQMKIHLVDLDSPFEDDDEGKRSRIAAVTHAFLHPPEIVRGDFDKFINDYINDEL
jgi:hypothetical protein